MASIADFTQTRLSILLYDKASQALLRNLPLYAEVSIRGEAPSYTIPQQPEIAETHAGLQKWLGTHAGVLKTVKEVIVGNVSEADYQAVPDKNHLLLSILDKVKANFSDADSAADQKQLITKMVLSVLQRLKVPVSAQPVTEAVLSHPLGTLASDHAGYLSFDLTAARDRFTNLLRDGQLVKPSVAFTVYPRGRDNLQMDVCSRRGSRPT